MERRAVSSVPFVGDRVPRKWPKIV